MPGKKRVDRIVLGDNGLTRHSIGDLADFAALAIVIWAQWHIGISILNASRGRAIQVQNFIRALLIAVAVWLLIGFAFTYHSVVRMLPLPAPLRGALTGGAYLWAFGATGGFLFYMAWRRFAKRTGGQEFNPQRRQLVNVAGGVLAAAPFALAGWGMIQRTDFHVREVDIPIPNLPRDLQGLRILQLSDIHLGPFLSERELARVIDASQTLRPHLAVITGDLISMRGDPLDACLRQIARVRADAGILGCMGNHEVYSGVQQYTTTEGARLGIDFLRQRARALRFGEATLNVAGVDYQPFTDSSNYLSGAERLIAPGAVNVLLSHNPDVFPVAAGKGYDVTIAGHTHGGQINVEILHQDVNIARFFTPFVYGYYRLKRPSGAGASLYVSRGIGTIALPIRLGAPPEITLLRLVAL
jgi:predicted MPP superfamily phosphohydrolase